MQDCRRRVSIRWNNIIGIRYREELILLSYRLNTALKNDRSISTKHNTITIEFPYYRVDVFFFRRDRIVAIWVMSVWFQG